MVGCGGTNEETPATTPDTKAPAASTEEAAAPAETADGDYHFEVIVKSFQSTYWQAAVKGIETACGELGVTANANGPAKLQTELVWQHVIQTPYLTLLQQL